MNNNLTRKKNSFLFLYNIIFFTFFLFSCASNRNLVYFSNLPQDGETSTITNNSAAIIQPGDLLHIAIVTLNPEFNQLFTSGAIPSAPTTIQSNNTNVQVSNDLSKNGFLVDGQGRVNLPVLGSVQLSGLTAEQAQQKLTTEVAKSAKDPIVNVRFLNYKVTVIGEVAKPGSFTILNEKINVLEALGLAGDMTAYGIRNNVLVIREKEGQRTIKSLNLNDKDVFGSPFFQLQQNDIVYVQPANKEKNANANAAANSPLIAVITAAVSAIAVIITAIIK